MTNEPERDAIHYERFDPFSVPLDRTVVVEASAGTGKTYSITLMYLRAVLEKHLEPRQILVVTFTRAATSELRKRIRDGLESAHEVLSGRRSLDDGDLDPNYRTLLERFCGSSSAAAEARVSTALDAIDTASIVTIDGFLQRLLGRFAFESGDPFVAEVATDDVRIRERVAADVFTAIVASKSVADYRRTILRDVDAIDGLIAKVVAHPGLEIVPRPASPDEASRARDRFESAKAGYLGARAAAGPNDDVLAIVNSIRKHKVKSVSALSALDALASGDASPTRKRAASWEYVSARELEAKAKKNAYVSFPLFEAVDELLDSLVPLLTVQLGSEAHAIADAGRRRYDDATIGRGILTFDAIKRRVAALVVDPSQGQALASAIADEYHLALVDESQDTDATQFTVFRAVFDRPGRGLVIIGDPKQAIYGFRGADVHAYLDARRVASARYTMARNFRSRPEIVRTIDLLYRRAIDPFEERAIGYPPVEAGPKADAIPRLSDPEAEAAVELLRVPGASDSVDGIADDIVRTLARASFVSEKHGTVPVRPENIAVLCSSNSQVASVCDALRLRGVPAVASSNQSVLSSEEAGAVELLLRAALDPKDARAVRAVLFSSLFDLDVPTLHALGNDDAAWNRYVEILALVRRETEARGFGHAFARFVNSEGVFERLLVRPDGYRVVTNFQHVTELATRAAAEKKLGVEGLLAWLEQARASQGEGEFAVEERALRLEHAGDAVEVVTLHKSKGLEYDIVYVVGIARSPDEKDRTTEVVRLPDGRRILAVDVGLDAGHVASYRASLVSERARLGYVALTRAVASLRFVVASGDTLTPKGFVKSPLGRVFAPSELAAQDKDVEGFYAKLAAHYGRLRDEHGASIGIRLAPEPTSPVVRYVASSGPALVDPEPRVRVFTNDARTSSFSGLTADADSIATADRDRPSARESELESELDDPIDQVPAGRELGVLVHGILEVLEFDAGEKAIRDAVTRAASVEPGFETHVDALVRCVARTLGTQVIEGGPRLADIPRGRTFRELEFNLSVRSPKGFSAATLADVFREHAVPLGELRYADAVASLTFDSLHGFLRGFIDLVFEHAGRFYVVDYKSNRLGASSRYESAALVDPMIDHHYVLQHAIYTLAIHRMLRMRMRGYDYDAHLGGSLYLYVRGMSPEHGARRGVYFERLSRGFVDALDALFEGGAP